MADIFEKLASDKRGDAFFERILKKKKEGDIFERIDKAIPETVRTYIKSQNEVAKKSAITTNDVISIVKREIGNIPPLKSVEKVIEKQIIREVRKEEKKDTTKYAPEKELDDLKKRFQELMQDLENTKQILPLLGTHGGSGVIGLPNPAGHSGQFITTDGSQFSFASVSTSYGIGSTVTSGTSGSVLFIDSNGLLAQRNPGFTYDGSTLKLRVNGTANIQEWGDSSGIAGAVITAAREFSNAPASFAEQFGASASASGIQATAVGYGALARAIGSVVVGSSAAVDAASQYGIVIGFAASLTGSNNILIATGGLLSGDNTVVIGQGAAASIGDGVAVGKNAATGYRSTAVGAFTTASGYSFACAIGALSAVAADNTMALGGIGSFSTQVVINGTTATGQLDINVNSSSRIGQIIKLASSASVDAFQIQNNSTSVLANIRKDGYIKSTVAMEAAGGFAISAAGGFGFNTYFDPNSTWTNVNSGSTGFFFRFNALGMEIYSSTTGVNPTITSQATWVMSSGVLAYSHSGYMAIGGTATTAQQLLLISADAARIGQVIRGASGQSANSLEIQNNSSGILSSFDAAGILTLGLAGTQTGILKVKGTTSGTVTLTTAAAAGTWTFTLPTGAGTSGYLLQTDGSGVSSWVSKTTLKLPTPLFDHFADAGNSTTTETDLYSDTTAAGQLATNGDKLEAEYGGVFVSSATATRQIKIYFGGTAIFDTGALTLSLSSAWTAYVTLIRKDSATVRYMISFTTEGAALAAYTATGELGSLTLSNTNILKITGQAAGVGAATNDIVAKLSSVSYVPAA